MRIVFALLVAVPTFAAAQTPKDIANQIWPFGAPASSSQASSEPAAARGGGSAADLARLAGYGGARHVARETTQPGTVPASFTAADLSRLRGDQTPASTLFQAAPATRLVTR